MGQKAGLEKLAKEVKSATQLILDSFSTFEHTKKATPLE